jgi:hypothetical protein
MNNTTSGQSTEAKLSKACKEQGDETAKLILNIAKLVHYISMEYNAAACSKG